MNLNFDTVSRRDFILERMAIMMESDKFLSQTGAFLKASECHKNWVDDSLSHAKGAAKKSEIVAEFFDGKCK